MIKEVEDVEESEEFLEEIEEQELMPLNRHLKGRRTGKGSRGNTETEAMYKQALMDSIFGRFQQASRKLKLMITLAPDSPEPYHLLGTMHEQLGQYDKAAEYLFMSTYLSPPNLQKWLKVGQLSFQRRMYSQAAYCFGRALKIANCDPKIMLRRAEAFELADQPKKAIITYKRLLNTASSPEYAKKYAKLRFRRGEYSLCRQILQNQPNFKTDPHLVYMACQTYLKQQQYAKSSQLLESHLQQKQKSMQQGQQLPAQFLLVMLICAAALKKDCYGYSIVQLLKAAKDCYDDCYSELYAEVVNHVGKFSEEVAYELVKFLISYPHHQTVSNFVLTTDYLCRLKDMNTCLAILEQGLAKHPHAPELLAQQHYINKCFGIKKVIKPLMTEDIFYSDEDGVQSQSQIVVTPPLKRKKKGAIQTEDPQIIVKLLQNITSSLQYMLQQIGEDKISLNAKSHEQVLQSLDFFINLTPCDRQRQGQKEGLYLRNISRRRGQGQNRTNILYSNIPLVLQFFQKLVEYMLALLKQKQYKKMSQIGQRVSKVYVFKNQNKRSEFVDLKIKMYQLSLLGCLAVRKFHASLFFMRYLAGKYPDDQLYLLSLHLLMRLCRKKTFLSSALSKKLDNSDGHHLARLLAIQYMDTGCFELAVSTFLKLSRNQQQFGITPQLCLSACLIQIASSRNTYNKLDFTNRSALCFSSYMKQLGECPEVLFNRGRWFAQVKLNHKAIISFEAVLLSDCTKELTLRAAYSLICIYKECQNYTKVSEIRKKYFSIEQEQIM